MRLFRLHQLLIVVCNGYNRYTITSSATSAGKIDKKFELAVETTVVLSDS